MSNMKSGITGNGVIIFLLALFLLGSVVGLFSVTSAQTSEPPHEPILRIETGMHTESINSMSTDAAGRYLVTTSRDKTIRIWEMPSARPLRVIRTAIGDGNLGSVGSVTLSPDGQTIMAGVTTDSTGQVFAGSIYFYDRETGKVVKRIQMPEQSRFGSLTYSQDGSYFAVALWSKEVHGFRVYDAHNFRVVGEDNEGGNNVGFDSSNRLVSTGQTSQYQGFVRLYGKIEANTSLRLVARIELPGFVRSSRFSPDGSKIVVTVQEQNQRDYSIAVLSGNNLSTLYRPDLGGPQSEYAPFDPEVVTWSYDGTILYAGSVLKLGASGSFIRGWADAGRGKSSDVQAGDTNVVSMIALQGGGIIYATSAPSLRVMDPQGKSRLLVNSTIARFPAARAINNFLTSADGMTVQFSLMNPAPCPHVFH